MTGARSGREGQHEPDSQRDGFKEETAMTSSETFKSRPIDVGVPLREGYAQVGEVKLHYVEAGDGNTGHA
jgi:hypothetical protein